MSLRRSQLLAVAPRQTDALAVDHSPANLKSPVQRLAKLWLEQVKTKPQRRPSKRAGEVALKLVKTMGKDPEPQMSALKENWAEIAGTSFASRTAPEKLSRSKDGLTLVLKVEGAAAPMIQHQATQILARVNLYAGPPGIKALNIIQGPVVKSPVRKAPAPPAPIRLDTSQEADIERLVATIDDEKLKAALRQLGRGIYARNARKRA